MEVLLAVECLYDNSLLKLVDEMPKIVRIRRKNSCAELRCNQSDVCVDDVRSFCFRKESTNFVGLVLRKRKYYTTAKEAAKLRLP